MQFSTPRWLTRCGFNEPHRQCTQACKQSRITPRAPQAHILPPGECTRVCTFVQTLRVKQVILVKTVSRSLLSHAHFSSARPPTSALRVLRTAANAPTTIQQRFNNDATTIQQRNLTANAVCPRQFTIDADPRLQACITSRLPDRLARRSRQRFASRAQISSPARGCHKQARSPPRRGRPWGQSFGTREGATARGHPEAPAQRDRYLGFVTIDETSPGDVTINDTGRCDRGERLPNLTHNSPQTAGKGSSR